MASSRSSLPRFLLTLFAAVALFQACSAREGDDGAPPALAGAGAGGISGSSAGTAIPPEAGAPPAVGGTGATLNPLCGLGGCIPDLVRSCALFAGEGQAGAGGATVAEQVMTLGGSGAAGASGSSGDGGLAGSLGGSRALAGSSGLGGESNDAGAGGVAMGVPEYACRVVQAPRRVESECGPTGRGAIGSPCFASADCGAGLACTAEPGGTIGRCRAFCCRGESSCDAHPGTYCSEQTLHEGGDDTGAIVPVCVTADQCDLAEPPCDAGVGCGCPAGTACLVARADGTTACRAPGAGRADEPCPCAYGFVCSQATGTCLELCSTQDSRAVCTSGRCQASSALPEGWGACVGR